MATMEALWVTSQIVDMIWIGRLGSSAIAGAGVANIVLFLLMSMDYGLIVGVRAMIARRVGAEDMAGANFIAGQAFVLCTVWGAFITVAGLCLAGPIMRLSGVAPAVAAIGTSYLHVMFGGWVSLEVLVMGLYVIQASGDAITPMKIELCIRMVHVTLCPFLVLGVWVFPRMGVAGAALSNVVSQLLGAFVGLWILFKGRSRLGLVLRDFRASPRTMWQILKIGVPALIMSFQASFGSLALTWFVIPFGTLAIAAHSLASRIDVFLYMPGAGLGSGAGVLVGQNLGARQPERAERCGWLAAGFGEALMIGFSVSIMIWAEGIVAVFTSDPGLISLSAVFLRIATAGYLVLALVSVLQSSIAGAGDTVPNMVISLGMIWLIQLPLAFLLPHFTGLGVYGVRWAIVASTVAGTIAYVAYFKLGKWKVKRV